MTETIFAGKKVKELPLKKTAIFLTSSHTVISGFAKHFFVGYSPRDTGNWNGQDE